MFLNKAWHTKMYLISLRRFCNNRSASAGFWHLKIVFRNLSVVFNIGKSGVCAAYEQLGHY